MFKKDHSQNLNNHFFKAGFSVNIVILSYHKGQLKILLQKKEEEFVKGELGLIGNFMRPQQETDKALEEILDTTIKFSDFYTKELSAFSEVDRHPMGRVVNFTYYGLVCWERFETVEDENLIWHNLYETPDLCYDHNKILKTVIKRFRKGLLRHPNVFELLPKEFIISDVIKIYEQAFIKKIDSPNFRKKIRKSELVIPIGKLLVNKKNQGRKPELYKFDKAKYKQNKEKVKFNF